MNPKMLDMFVLYRVPGHSGLRTGTIIGIGEAHFIVKDYKDSSHWKIPFEYVTPTTKEGIRIMNESRLAHDIRTATSPAFVNLHFWTFVKAHYTEAEIWTLGKQATFLQEPDVEPTV